MLPAALRIEVDLRHLARRAFQHAGNIRFQDMYDLGLRILQAQGADGWCSHDRVANPVGPKDGKFHVSCRRFTPLPGAAGCAWSNGPHASLPGEFDHRTTRPGTS